jgi:hypothetical protein
MARWFDSARGLPRLYEQRDGLLKVRSAEVWVRRSGLD